MPETIRNPYRGELVIELADGIARTFHFNLNATVLTARVIASRGEDFTVGEAKLVAIWAGFQDYAKDSGQELTLDQVGRLVLPCQIDELLAAVNEAKNGPGEPRAGGVAESAAAKASPLTGEGS